MNRIAFDLMISDHVEFQINDDKALKYIFKQQEKHMKEDYPPATGHDKTVRELCNVLCAYRDAMRDAELKGYEIEPEQFGDLCYDVMMEILGKL